jgi:hypothetical protein
MLVQGKEIMSIGPLWKSVKQRLDAVFASAPEEAKTHK